MITDCEAPFRLIFSGNRFERWLARCRPLTRLTQH